MGSLLHLPERCGLNRISCNLNQEHVCMNLAYFQLNLRFYDRSHVDGRLYANRDERVGLVDRARSLLASRLAHIIIIIIRSSSSSSRSSSPSSSPIQPHTRRCGNRLHGVSVLRPLLRRGERAHWTLQNEVLLSKFALLSKSTFLSYVGMSTSPPTMKSRRRRRWGGNGWPRQRQKQCDYTLLQAVIMSFTQLIFWYHFPFLKLIHQENHFITNSNWKLNYCGFWIVAGYEYLEQLDNKCPEVPTRVAAKSMWKSYQPCIFIFKSRYDDEIVLMVKMARQTNAELRIRRPQPQPTTRY